MLPRVFFIAFFQTDPVPGQIVFCFIVFIGWKREGERLGRKEGFKNGISNIFSIFEEVASSGIDH